MSAESSRGWLHGAQPPASESERRLPADPGANGHSPSHTTTTPATTQAPATTEPPATPATPPPALPAPPGTAATPPIPAHAAPPARYVPGSGETHRHVLVAIVLNKPGVLNRVASLMRARNFNIESLAVSHSDEPHVSRMTITLNGDDVAVEQAAKQLYRLIDVLKVQDVTNDPTVEHELALVKVRATDRNRSEVIRIVELYKGRIVDVASDSVIVEATGTESEVDGLVALLGSFGIKELVRTGAVVMSRGSGSIEENYRRPSRRAEVSGRPPAEAPAAAPAGPSAADPAVPDATNRRVEGRQ